MPCLACKRVVGVIGYETTDAGVRSIAIVACALAFSLGAFVAPAYADGATVTKITNKETGATYENLATATADAKSGETILLPEGNYTLYKVSSEGHTKGKDLTFEGLGTDKTAWNIGALVPDPANYGTEYNGDYSFDGAGHRYVQEHDDALRQCQLPRLHSREQDCRRRLHC